MALNAFIDESGSYGFNFINHNTHFVVTVILVDQGQATELLENAFTGIIQDIFHGAEVKSSNIKDRTRRRIFEIIKDFNFSYYSLIIDKRDIYDESGIHNWKESFYKYLFKQLYEKLYSTFSNINIQADELIDKHFIEGLRIYLLRETQNTIFQTITFQRSRNIPLIQLADIISGTINRFVSGKSNLDLYYILFKQNTGFLLWPPKKTRYFKQYVTDDAYAFDIQRLSLLRANSFIEKNKHSDDPDMKLRIKLVEYLKEVLLYRGNNVRVRSAELINALSIGSQEKLSDQYFRAKILAPLRDSDVLITSNRIGYKLPACKNDLLEFIEMFFANIDPMIRRMKNCYDAVKLATTNKLDLLEEKKYFYLRELFNKGPQIPS